VKGVLVLYTIDSLLAYVDKTAFFCLQWYQHALSWYSLGMCEETAAVVLSLCKLIIVFILKSVEFLASVV